MLRNKFMIAGWILFLPMGVGATMTVTPVWNEASPNALANVSNNIFYYGVRTASYATLTDAYFDTTNGFYSRDVTLGQGTDPLRSDGLNRPNALCFDVASSSATVQGKQFVLTVAIGSSVGANPLPIASSGSAACTAGAGTADNCVDPIIPNNPNITGTAYRGAKYTPGSTLRVCVYPRDLCVVVGVDGNGCKTMAVDANPTTPAQIPVIFEIKSADVQSDSSLINVASVDSTSGSNYRLSLQVAPPAIACPDLKTVYFPGDGEILVNTTGFGNALLSTSPTSAPARTLYVVADRNHSINDIDDSVAGFPNNENVRPIPIGSINEPAIGFNNTSNGSDNKYAVSFLVRDAAGMFASPSAAGLSPIYPAACRVMDVQTSNIQTFLSGSKCFIATAAFRSGEAPSVTMLRKFRDRVLSRFELGQEFIDWYYAWSPQSAEWLMRNPMFRMPVLVALLPVQFLAWFALHSFWVLGLMILGMIPLSLAMRARMRDREAP